MTPEERLDRIERLVGANAQAIAENTLAIANNTQAIAEMRETMQQGFAETRDQIEQSSSYLVGAIGDFVEEMQQDREKTRQVIETIREMQSEVRGLQVENQRILRHLFGEEQ